MQIRELQPNESDVLKDFLYEAIFLPEGTEPPERSIVKLPELRIYYEGFGEGKADFCMVAEDDGRMVGAAWTRLMKDYGYVDDETPSFAISLYREYRGQGIGTKLMLAMLEKLQENGFKRASLAVQKANYAVRMYEKVGFRTVSENEEEYIMVCDLTEDVASRVAEEFTKRSRQILGDNLVGVYLHGSAVMGCFNPGKSDVDLLVVVNKEPTDTVKRAFMDMVVSLNETGPAKGIEMSVVRRGVCKPFVYPTPFELHFSKMHLDWYRSNPEDYIAKMKGTDRDLAAHITVTRARGVCLCGESIDEVFGEVPKQAYMDSLWYDIADAEDDIAEDTMYLTLNLARVLAFQRDGSVLSKKEGGEWGIKNLPEKYHGLLRDALSEYRGAKPEYDRNAAKEYASEMLQRIRNKEIQASIEPVKGDY
jgi:streptomycin 3"-adenylyltransferase